MGQRRHLGWRFNGWVHIIGNVFLGVVGLVALIRGPSLGIRFGGLFAIALAAVVIPILYGTLGAMDKLDRTPPKRSEF